MGRKPKVEPSPCDSKMDEARNIIREANKKLGYQALKPASEEKDRERIPFACEELNKLSGGGIPCGSFSVVWGAKGVAKTTQCFGLIANAQKVGKVCVFFDLENSFDPKRAESFGVDLEKLLVGHFDTAEEALDVYMELASKKAVDLAIIDSVQALSPTGEQRKKNSEKTKSLEDDTMALLARKLSQFFRMTTGKTYKANAALVLIGQARMDLGGFIPVNKLSGGNALEHWASLIIHIRRGTKADAPRYKFKDSQGKRKEIIIGFNTVAVLDKKKVSNAAPEKTQTSFPFYELSAWRKPENEEVEQYYKDWIDFESLSDEED